MMSKKGQTDPNINIFLGLAFLLIGFFAAFIVFMGFVLKNPDLLFIGSVITGIISLLIAILEKVMFR